ncbi:hypothetical protein DRQ15_00720 [candidate division KSB1 bacterium]|nr:MAG: hypothetical protein DRQ15_00720 [candidate division KSB1 bacterium]
MKPQTILLIGIVSVVGFSILVVSSAFDLNPKWLIVFMMILAGGLFLSMVKEREEYILRLMIFLIPFELGAFYTWILKVDLIFAFDVFLFFLYCIWLFRTHGFREEKINFGKVSWPTIGIILWSIVSIFPAISQRAAIFGVFMTVKAFMLYLYIINNITTKKRLQIVVNWLIIGLSIQVALGIVQKTLHTNFGFEALGAPRWYWYSSLSRVTGTLGFPNQYGAYLILLLPLAASLFIFYKKSLPKIWYGGIVVAGGIALIFSLSRSSWIGLIGAILIIIGIMIKRRKLNSKLVFTTVLVVLIIVIIGIVYRDLIMLRLETGGKGEYRLLMIDIALPIIANNPIFGVGLNNYQYHSFSIFKFWHPVHNTYLRLAAEVGLPGLFFFLWFVFNILREAYRGLKLKDEYLNAVALGVIGGLWAFLIAVNFGPQYQHYRQKCIFWLLAGLAVTLKRINKMEIIRKQRNQTKKQYLAQKLSPLKK